MSRSLQHMKLFLKEIIIWPNFSCSFRVTHEASDLVQLLKLTKAGLGAEIGWYPWLDREGRMQQGSWEPKLNQADRGLGVNQAKKEKSEETG